MSERIRAGIERARLSGTKSGKRIGRQPIAPKLRDQIAKRFTAGETAYRIAKDLGLDPHTVKKYGLAAVQ